MSAHKARVGQQTRRSILCELDGTVGAMFAYVASMRPLRGVADVEGRVEYQRGRSLIQRLGISATGDGMPTLALSPRDCADILYFMHYSEPVESERWWEDPAQGPSHVLGMNIALQVIEKSLRQAGDAA
jgi:hypothetical protein